jgi:copper(I)-binding protein
MATARPALRAAALAPLLVSALGLPALAEGNDLREFRVGMPVAALPAQGYEGFTCAASGQPVAGWADWRTCPPDPSGLRAVAFRYDDRLNPMARLSDDAEGTKVGGHPVVLALLVGEDAIVRGLRIETDDGARLCLRKKAFLLANQVKERYGEEGWRCDARAPGAGEEPVGGVFVKEHCEKTADGRRYLLDHQLFRRAGTPLKDFVGATQLTILAQAAAPAVAAIELAGAWVPATAEKGADVPLHLTVANNTDRPDELQRVRCPVAQFTEKRTVDQGEGGTAHREVRSIPVPANATTRLEPEGFHVVLLQTTQPLREGEAFTYAVSFKAAGPKEVVVTVKPPPAP